MEVQLSVGVLSDPGRLQWRCNFLWEFFLTPATAVEVQLSVGVLSDPGNCGGDAASSTNIYWIYKDEKSI